MSFFTQCICMPGWQWAVFSFVSSMMVSVVWWVAFQREVRRYRKKEIDRLRRELEYPGEWDQ